MIIKSFGEPWETFQLLSYGGSEEIRTARGYNSQTILTIAQKRSVQASGLIKPDDLTVGEHKKTKTISKRKMIVRILRPFQNERQTTDDGAL